MTEPSRLFSLTLRQGIKALPLLRATSMDELTVQELRSAERFLLNTAITASFGAAGITIVNFSAHGLQALHAEPIKLGAEGRLAFALPNTPERVAVRARVVWSHLAKSNDPRGKYLSGFRIEGQPDLAAAVDRLVSMNLVTPDIESLDRKREALREKAKQRAAHSSVKIIASSSSALTADEQLMVQHARERLQSHPDEAVKWYARAKFAPPELQARVVQLHHNKEDVLAVWEYLERTIDLDKIARAFEMKK